MSSGPYYICCPLSMPIFEIDKFCLLILDLPQLYFVSCNKSAWNSERRWNNEFYFSLS